MIDFNNLYNDLSDEYTLKETSFHSMEQEKVKLLHILKAASRQYPELRVENMDGNAISINGIVVRVN